MPRKFQEEEDPSTSESPSPSQYLPAVAPREVSSNPVIIVPVIIFFLVLYAGFLLSPAEYGWNSTPWLMSTVSVALVLVSIARRKYDGWSFGTEKVVVDHRRVMRTYRRAEVCSVQVRYFFTGFASVAESGGLPLPRGTPWVQAEVTLKMKNGDQTSAILPSSHPSLEKIKEWASPSPPRPTAGSS